MSEAAHKKLSQEVISKALDNMSIGRYMNKKIMSKAFILKILHMD